MLLYHNRSLRLVLALYGSIALRPDNVAMAIFIGAVAAFLQWLRDRDSEYAPRDFPNHYGINALGVVVGWAVIFRTNLGWARYWEAVGQLHTTYSKWDDAYAQIFAFTQVSVERARNTGTPEGRAKADRVQESMWKLTADMILLSAIAAHRLHSGDVQYMEALARRARWSGKIVKREQLQQSRVASHQELPQFEVPRDDVDVDRIPSGSNWETSYLVAKLPSEGEAELLTRSTDRVAVVMYWVVRELARVSKDLDVAPPIQTRMYQELSNGMLGFNQCVKLADVPFPFPYAQILTILLVCFTCFIPFYIVALTDSIIAGPILTCLIFDGFWGLNETAKELENPFGWDENDISLMDFHLRFVSHVRQIWDQHEWMTSDGRPSKIPISEHFARMHKS